jgi:hypothetical protein
MKIHHFNRMISVVEKKMAGCHDVPALDVLEVIK